MKSCGIIGAQTLRERRERERQRDGRGVGLCVERMNATHVLIVPPQKMFNHGMEYTYTAKTDTPSNVSLSLVLLFAGTRRRRRTHTGTRSPRTFSSPV